MEGKGLHRCAHLRPTRTSRECLSYCFNKKRTHTTRAVWTNMIVLRVYVFNIIRVWDVILKYEKRKWSDLDFFVFGSPEYGVRTLYYTTTTTRPALIMQWPSLSEYRLLFLYKRMHQPHPKPALFSCPLRVVWCIILRKKIKTQSRWRSRSFTSPNHAWGHTFELLLHVPQHTHIDILTSRPNPFSGVLVS